MYRGKKKSIDQDIPKNYKLILKRVKNCVQGQSPAQVITYYQVMLRGSITKSPTYLHKIMITI